MRTSVLIGLLAGSALSTSAFAQDEHTLTAIPLKGIVPQVVTLDHYGKCTPGMVPLIRHSERGAPGIVYDRISTLDSYFYFGFGLQPNNADDISLSPGAQSGLYAPGGQVITGMDLVIGSQDTLGTGRNFDMHIDFYEDANEAAVGADAFMNLCTTTAAVPASFVATISGLPAGFWIFSFGFTGIAPALADDGIHLNIYYTEVGVPKPAGYTLASGLGNIGAVYNSCSSYGTSGNQLAATNINGYSMPWFFLDNNADGFCDSGERFRIAGANYLIPCDLTVNLYGDVRCPADFNNDGFVDPLDYNGFINAFETPCP